MIAVIKGEIIGSGKISHQEKWLKPLQSLLGKWACTPEYWEIVWGNFFQIEVLNVEDVLHKALAIKALIKKIAPEDLGQKASTVDVRMAIGIGDKTYCGRSISESNGPAFVYAGDQFATLKKEKTIMAIKSDWKEFDDDMNLYLELSGIFMDKWTVSSAEVFEIALNNPGMTQEEIGLSLGIKQNSVSGRWNRANVDEILRVEKTFRQKIICLLPG